MKAVIAYQKKLNSSTSVPKPLKHDIQEMEKKRKVIVRSFSLARNLYVTGHDMDPIKESELEAGAEFLEVVFTFEICHLETCIIDSFFFCFVALAG